MKDHRTCPICNKSCIPNYMDGDVKCPCCGADLSVYRKIELAKESARKPKKLVWPVGLLCGIIIVIMIIGYLRHNNSYREKLESAELKLSSLTDNNKLLTAERDSLLKLVECYKDKVEDDMITYIVKKGDSFCRISKRLYGTENRYMEIVEENKRSIDTPLYEGDSLKVKRY